MFGLGTTEIVIILVLALLLFGPQKLPEIGKQIGGMLREFRNMSGDVQRALDLDSHNDYDNHYAHRSSYEYNYKSDTSHALPSAPTEEEQEEKAIAPFAYSAPTSGAPIASTAAISDHPEETTATDATAPEGDVAEEVMKNKTAPETSGTARVYNEPEASDTGKVALDATSKE